MTFGEKLKTARLQACLTQAELAKQLKTTNTTISNWEKNVSKPDLDTLSFICGALHVSASYFLQARIPEDEVNIKELEMIKKYRNLDLYGQETVSYILDRELKRVEQINKQKDTPPIIVELFPTRHYLQSASAGYGDFNDDNSYETIDLVKQPPVGTSFIVTVNGESMEPTYKDGELLFVKAQETINIGQNGLFTKNGNLYIKEFGENCLISHNKNGNYPIIYPEMDAPIITQGRIIGICTEDYLPR